MVCSTQYYWYPIEESIHLKQHNATGKYETEFNLGTKSVYYQMSKAIQNNSNLEKAVVKKQALFI